VYERHYHPPRERECELCGREERWDDDADGWRIEDEPGDVYCIHEWDINGSFTPDRVTVIRDWDCRSWHSAFSFSSPTLFS